MWKKVAEMSVRDAISIVAGPRSWGDTRESWLTKAARKSGIITPRMMRSLWNDEVSATHWAAVEIKRQAESLTRAKAEASDLAERYLQIAGGLNAKDQDFYSEDVAALVRAARVLRGLDRT